MFDINSAETYILKQGILPSNDRGFVVHKDNIADLRKPFATEYSIDYNNQHSKLSGTLCAANISKWEDVRGTFGLVDKASNDFTDVGNGLHLDGRMGINSWLPSQTNVSYAVLSEVAEIGFYFEMGPVYK